MISVTGIIRGINGPIFKNHFFEYFANPRGRADDESPILVNNKIVLGDFCGYFHRSKDWRLQNFPKHRYASRWCTECVIEVAVQGIADGIRVVTRISVQ